MGVPHGAPQREAAAGEAARPNLVAKLRGEEEPPRLCRSTCSQARVPKSARASRSTARACASRSAAVRTRVCSSFLCPCAPSATTPRGWPSSTARAVCGGSGGCSRRGAGARAWSSARRRCGRGDSDSPERYEDGSAVCSGGCFRRGAGAPECAPVLFVCDKHVRALNTLDTQAHALLPEATCENLKR